MRPGWKMKPRVITFTTHVHLIPATRFDENLARAPAYGMYDGTYMQGTPNRSALLLNDRDDKWQFTFAGSPCYGWPILIDGRVAVLWNYESNGKGPFEAGWVVVQP